MGKYSIDMDRYKKLARQVAAEGCVLLKNDMDALPLKKGDNVAVFGRIAFDYYKSGLGSGGLVNTRYVVSILDALKAEEDITINEAVYEIYEDWLEAHPYEIGEGWGKVPWCQEEMPVTEGLLEAATSSDVAIVIVGRTAGEDQDNRDEGGSFLLTDIEKDLVKSVSEAFARTVVLLNVGNIIDMKWVEECAPAAVMYVWQGGQEGGNGVADVLMGRVNPCGKLTDTIAVNIDDYPSYPYFGDPVKNFYAEDIYVGYRYFETFAKKNVLYPFGFGLSYTSFEVGGDILETEGDSIKVIVSAKNTGKVPGREVIQVYVKAPQGVLGKPLRALIAFTKTKVLAPGEHEEQELVIPKYYYASYDDSSITGHKSCYVLEPGAYEIYVGSDVRSAQNVGWYMEELTVLQQLQEAYAPTENFKRIRPVMCEDDNDRCNVSFEDVPTRTIDWRDRVIDYPIEIPYTGDQGIRLKDVFEEKVPIEDFIGQLSDDDLMALFRGEGMSSSKVTAGTGGAFGGLTERHRFFGIPAACVTDGPSGLRFDVGTKAFSLPNGTMLGCTFDEQLSEDLFEMVGLELRKNRVDALLGPGLNIHRHPLNGRNFEYVSEDPLLSGKLSAAQIKGMNKSGSTGTIKHFCGNNQESHRRTVEGVVSERALREIYLRGFEICVKEAKARAVMTSYGAINGLWTAGSYDLNTTILRQEWGFKGIVMTDWWAQANEEGSGPSPVTHAPMVMAQNDVYMLCNDASDNEQDDVYSKLQSGQIFRCQLQRNAKNILEFILKSPAMLYELNLIDQEELDENAKVEDEEDLAIKNVAIYKSDKHGNIVIDGCDFQTGKRGSILFGIEEDIPGEYDMSISVHSTLGELAQLPVSFFINGASLFTVTFRGSEGKIVTDTRKFPLFAKNAYIKLYFGADGIILDSVKFTAREK